ncbi:RNA-directed DNA polymerase, eukaryota [Tanacetum coccineum]
MGSIDLSSVRSCWGNSNFDYVHSDSVGNSGGILCIWDPNSFRRSSFTRSDYFVIVRGVWLKSGIDLMIVVVYAPQEAKEKRMLWDYLAHVSNQWVGKLVMMGDFNEVRYKSDRYGSNFNAHDAEIFNSFIYNAGLDEVPLGGSAYTWCLKSASKMSKLDRFFVSENLLSMCPNITAITLERFISDHRPILLREVRYDYGPIPFRFYRYWLEVDGFDKLVRDSWNVAPVNKKNAIRNFMGKLKFLKDRIRSWLSIHRSNSRGEIYFLKEELRSCDEVIDKGDCSNEVVHKRTEILNKIHQVNNIQASEIAQKAKIKWAIEGDENVKFFHGMLNKKRNQSNIRGIMVNGTWVDDPVQDCGVDKSPGPDGFSFGFYRHFWPVIEKDVFEAVDYFLMYGEIPNGCNSNFIALIPKILDANMVKDFRPISLIGSLYKIITKILANRLFGVLGDIVNEVQSAFVADRQILNGPFILDEVLQWCRRKKKHALIFKVDFEKAFDSRIDQRPRKVVRCSNHDYDGSLIEKSTPLVDTGHSNQEDDHAAKDIPRITSMMMEKNKEDDMYACFKKLENIGWGTEDPLYDTALLLFVESAEYRKLWLLLKPESCGKWVKNAGTPMQFFSTSRAATT